MQANTMKITNHLKQLIQYYLIDLTKTNTKQIKNPYVIEILMMILDENSMPQDVASKLTKLEEIISFNDFSDFSDYGTQTNLDKDALFAFMASIWVLGLCYENGFGVKQDLKRAVQLYQQAAQYGFAYAQDALGSCYKSGLFFEKDFKKAVEFYKLAADQGFAIAQFNLGVCYQYGKGVEKDLKQAFDLCQKSAEQEFSCGQNGLGAVYTTTLVVDKDLKRASMLFRLSADQDNAKAQCNLGVCYQYGMGVEKDLKKAVELYELSDQNGCADALRNLGKCYEKGDGVEKNLQKAIELYQKAIHNGSDDPLLDLGDCYYKGIGVEKDLYQAMDLYKQAIFKNQPFDSGLPHFKLGKCYEDLGGCVFKTRALLLYQQAFKLNPKREMFKKAIDSVASYLKNPKRNTPLIYVSDLQDYVSEKDYRTLGFCYHLGLGVEKDFKMAMAFYKIAIKKYSPCYLDLYQCYRDLSSNNLTKVEIDEFDAILKKNSARTVLKQNKLICFAYMNETGRFFVDQNLYAANAHYEEVAKSLYQFELLPHYSWLKNKIDKYSGLNEFKEKLQNLFLEEKHLQSATQIDPSATRIVPLIAEYAYEPKF